MIKKLGMWLESKGIDALSVGNWSALLLLVSDTVWYHRDLIMGGFTWHLGVIAGIFIISYTILAISTVWYSKTKNKNHQLEKRIESLEYMERYQAEKLQLIVEYLQNNLTNDK